SLRPRGTKREAIPSLLNNTSLKVQGGICFNSYHLQEPIVNQQFFPAIYGSELSNNNKFLPIAVELSQATAIYHLKIQQ
ncbi:MAG: hypothetical protein ACERKD_19790, partial [Prolixibacteraceae bacterium]